MKTKEHSAFFKRLEKGMLEALAWARGEIELRTTLVTGPDPAPFLTDKDIRKLRRKLKMSQGVFAKALNVSEKTVQSWEQGERKPSQASARLLQIMNEKPQVVCSAAGIENGKPKPTRRISKKSA